MELGSSSKRAKSLPNWLDLPRDVMILIFLKLGVLSLIHEAQHVCLSWRAIAQDPRLYRFMDLCDTKGYFDSFARLTYQAIKRSRGQLIEFSIGRLWTKPMLHRLAYQAPLLKSLRFPHINAVDYNCLVQVVQKLPLLEDVEFSDYEVSDKLIEALGRCCPQLKSFRLNRLRELYYSAGEHNSLAFAVAENLSPGLRRLHLLWDSMDSEGLEAILEKFSQLEYLDIRRCSKLDLEGDLLRKCQGIKTLRLPNDSIEDLEKGYRWIVCHNSLSEEHDSLSAYESEQGFEEDQ